MPFPYTLTPDQEKDIAETIGLLEQYDGPVLLCRPTGSGKTVCACFIIDLWTQAGLTVCFMVERRVLIYQASNKCEECGIEHGIVMAGEDPKPWCDVQLISRDTIRERVIKKRRMYMPVCDLLIRDEAHRGMSESDLKIYHHLSKQPGGVRILGLSATPAFADGTGLGAPLSEEDPIKQFGYRHLVYNFTHQDAIDKKLLLPNVIYQPRPFEDQMLSASGGDYDLSEKNAGIVEGQNPMGDLAKDWKNYAEDSATFLFCCTIKQSRRAVDILNGAGIPSAHVDMNTNHSERFRLMKESKEGRIKVVSSCEVMGYGVDWPWVRCCQHLRPCKNPVPWVQNCGRANRTFGDQNYAIQIDHVGNVTRLGFPEDCTHWSLDRSSTVRERMQDDPENRLPAVCGSCGAAKPRPGPCAQCGMEVERPTPRGEVQLDAAPLTRAKRRRRSNEQKTWDTFKGIAIYRGYTLKWAASRYKENTGSWPKNDLNQFPQEQWMWSMNARTWYDRHIKAPRDAATERGEKWDGNQTT